MFRVNNNDIYMTEHDFNVALPVTINGAEFDNTDSVKIVIKKNDEVVLEKIYNEIQDNTFNFILSETESELLPLGHYFYHMDWYEDGAFRDCIVEKAKFIVTDKV